MEENDEEDYFSVEYSSGEEESNGHLSFGGASATAGVSEWVCLMCGVVNEISEDTCNMCNTAGPEEVESPSSPSVTIEAIEATPSPATSVPTSQPAPAPLLLNPPAAEVSSRTGVQVNAHSGTERARSANQQAHIEQGNGEASQSTVLAEEWECSLCLFLNDAEASSCEMCQAKKNASCTASPQLNLHQGTRANGSPLQTVLPNPQYQVVSSKISDSRLRKPLPKFLEHHLSRLHPSNSDETKTKMSSLTSRLYKGKNILKKQEIVEAPPLPPLPPAKSGKTLNEDISTKTLMPSSQIRQAIEMNKQQPLQQSHTQRLSLANPGTKSKASPNMAKVSQHIQTLKWKCVACKSTNPLWRQKCFACHSVQPPRHLKTPAKPTQMDWSCSLCTFLNAHHVRTCAICMSPKENMVPVPEPIALSPETDITKEKKKSTHKNPLLVGSKANANAPQIWNCHRCSYRNNWGFSYCEMCGAPYLVGYDSIIKDAKTAQSRRNPPTKSKESKTSMESTNQDKRGHLGFSKEIAAEATVLFSKAVKVLGPREFHCLLCEKTLCTSALMMVHLMFQHCDHQSESSSNSQNQASSPKHQPKRRRRCNNSNMAKQQRNDDSESEDSCSDCYEEEREEGSWVPPNQAKKRLKKKMKHNRDDDKDWGEIKNMDTGLRRWGHLELTEEQILQRKAERVKQLLNCTTEMMATMETRLAKFCQKSVESSPEGKGHGAKQMISNNSPKASKQRDFSPVKQPHMLVGGELRDYQLLGLNWLHSLWVSGLNGILADEMGLGKTVQVIALLCSLFETKGLQGPHLIICPLSVTLHWKKDLDHWAPNVALHRYHGEKDERKRLFQDTIIKNKTNELQIVITTYEMVMRDVAVLKNVRWGYLIVDEGHRLKNHHSLLSQALKQMQVKRRLLLTGTTLQNNLKELWALLNFILPSVFDSAQNFQDWLNAPFEEDGEEVELNADEQFAVIQRLHEVLRPFLLRRVKSEVLGALGRKEERRVLCPLSAIQIRLYEELMKKAKQAKSKSNQHAEPQITLPGKLFGINNILMQLQKVCNHPYLVSPLLIPDTQDEASYLQHLVRSCGKFAVLDKILERLFVTGHRIVIFSQMTGLLDLLEDFLQLRGTMYLRLDGSSSSLERAGIIEEFNAATSEAQVFLLSTRSGGAELNLQSADTVILYDSDWDPQMDHQAQAHCHRFGQRKDVLVLRLVSVGVSSLCPSIEERMLQRADSKLGVEQKAIQTVSKEERMGILQDLLHAQIPPNNPEQVQTPRSTLSVAPNPQEQEESSQLLRFDLLEDEKMNTIASRNHEETEMLAFLSKDKGFNRNSPLTGRSLSSSLPSLCTFDEVSNWQQVFKDGLGSNNSLRNDPQMEADVQQTHTNLQSG